VYKILYEERVEEVALQRGKILQESSRHAASYDDGRLSIEGLIVDAVVHFPP
jgi:hypothetical protein